jgi:hypothetical protein
MDNSAMDDASDPESQPGLTCQIEIEIESGTSPEIDAATAWALRNVADLIEGRRLESGFHPVQAPSGEKIGEAYLDYHETGPR